MLALPAEGSWPRRRWRVPHPFNSFIVERGGHHKPTLSHLSTRHQRNNLNPPPARDKLVFGKPHANAPLLG